MQIVMIILQFFIAFSIFNVWVLRYRTMASDFQQFGLPTWLRNIVGAIKIFFSIMLIAGVWNYSFTIVGGIGIAVLMVSAVAVHIKEKDPVSKMWPAIVLAILAIAVAILAYHFKFEVVEKL